MDLQQMIAAIVACGYSLTIEPGHFEKYRVRLVNGDFEWMTAGFDMFLPVKEAWEAVKEQEQHDEA